MFFLKLRHLWATKRRKAGSGAGFSLSVFSVCGVRYHVNFTPASIVNRGCATPAMSKYRVAVRFDTSR